MSVTSQTPYKKYTAAPGATVFSTAFRVLLATDLQVRVNDAVVTTGFSLAGLGAASVDVTFAVPRVGGEKIELQRITPLTRSTDYQQLGDFKTPVVNADFDRIWMSNQELAEELSRAVKVAIGSGDDPAVFIAELLAASQAAVLSATAAAASEAAADGSADAAAISAAAAAASVANQVPRTSTTGSAVIPSGTTAQRDATPAFGYQHANYTLGRMEWWNGSAWSPMGGGATGGGADAIFQENSRTMTTSYTLTTGKNALVVGPLVVPSGINLTVPAGQRLVVL